MGKSLYISRTSSESLDEWNKERIVSALMRETYLDRRTAETISDEVEKQVNSLHVGILTSALIRELVGAKLIEFGLERAHKMHSKLGVPLYDVEQIILHQGKNQLGFPPGPELTNLALASRIKREYALINVFSQEVTDAHLRGDIYLEGLEFIDRLYCGGLSLDYIKKFGLNFSEHGIRTSPAKHAGSLISQMVGFTEILRGHFSHSLEWDAVNTLFAPYTEGLSTNELKQLSQKMIFELSRQSMNLKVATLLNLYWDMPADLEQAPAIGTRAEETTPVTYKQYLAESQRVLLMLLEVLGEGDGEGKNFTLPLPRIHLSEQTSAAAGYSDFIETLSEYILQKGHAVLVFERAQPRRVFRSFSPPPKSSMQKASWQTRHAVINNVVINLPRVGYLAHGSDLHLFAKLSEMMQLVAEAHMQKRVFIEKLLAAGRRGSLGILMMKQDGKSFLQLEQADFLIGLIGLNELVQIHKGVQFHESDEAVAFGVEVIAHMQSVCERLSQRHHINFLLNGGANQAASSRLAHLDLRYYSPDSGYVVKGDLGTGNVYYSNAISTKPDETYPVLKRMHIEGRFCPYMVGNMMSWVPVEGQFSQKKSLVEFISAVFQETEISQIYFTPDASSNSLIFLN